MSAVVPIFHLLPTPAKLYVPVSTAARALPTGTVVARGAALTDGAVACPAIAPVSGTITGTSRRTCIPGRECPAVEIETKSEPFPWTVDEPLSDEQRQRAADRVRATRADEFPAWIDRLRAAGIWADRRDCPNLIEQLQQARSKKIDHLLCTALDSDPALPLNYALSARYGDALAIGAALLARLINVDRTLVVTEKRMEQPALLRRTARDLSARVVSIRNDYPRSDPTLLLRALTGRKLRPGQLPTECGVLLLDAAAAVAIGLLVLRDLPMVRVPFALRDHLRSHSHLMWLSPGTPLGTVLSACQISTDNVTLRSGDVLRDQRMPQDAIIAGAELTAHLTAAAPHINPEPCIRCSWCVEGCPTRVQPAALLEAAQRNDLKMAERYGLGACIECGICSYLCPSKLPLLPSIRRLKASPKS